MGRDEFMSSRTVMLVGPRSSKEITHGMSIAFDMLISGLMDENIQHKVIDRSMIESKRRIGSVSFMGIIVTAVMFFHFFVSLVGVDVVYIAIGTSRAGFFRDALMIWFSFLLNKKVVIHLHGGGYKHFFNSSPKWLRKTIQLTMNRVDTFIVLGELLRDQFYFVKDIEGKIKVVPNGFPGERVGSGEAKTLSKNRSFHILFLSNLHKSKGFIDVLEACSITVKKGSLPIKCDICGAFVDTISDEPGDTINKQGFLELVSDMNLDGIVDYHGTVRGNKKKEILKRADVFVLPTYYLWEGQPISIIEALAYGLPVITTEYRGIPEQIIDGYNGFFVPPRSPKNISNLIKKLWENPSLYKNMSRNAILHFEKNFTKDAHLNKIIPIIMGLTEN